jgi:hypothetical protein
MKDAFSEARNATSGPTSSMRPGRPSSMCGRLFCRSRPMASSVEIPCCYAACSIISLTSGVSIKAGLTVFTRMPSAAYCLERALEKLSRAPLEAL